MWLCCFIVTMLFSIFSTGFSMISTASCFKPVELDWRSYFALNAYYWFLRRSTMLCMFVCVFPNTLYNAHSIDGDLIYRLNHRTQLSQNSVEFLKLSWKVIKFRWNSGKWLLRKWTAKLHNCNYIQRKVTLKRPESSWKYVIFILFSFLFDLAVIRIYRS